MSRRYIDNGCPDILKFGNFIFKPSRLSFKGAAEIFVGVGWGLEIGDYLYIVESEFGVGVRAGLGTADNSSLLTEQLYNAR